jgi:hypothetical protein
MDLFTQRNPKKMQRTQEIKARVTQLLSLSDDVTVMVTELNCQDDDCPEVETVVAIFEPGKSKIQTTLHSSLEEITDAEIDEFCRNAQKTPQQPESSLGASGENNQSI